MIRLPTMTRANPTAAVPNCPHFQQLLFCEQGRGRKAVEIEDSADRAAAVAKISLYRHIASINAAELRGAGARWNGRHWVGRGPNQCDV